MSTFKQPEHPLTLVPGPVEFEDDVLEAMAHYSIAPAAQPFVEVFQSALKSLRTLFFNTDKDSQPFIINGSGTLGWDISAANFLEAGDDVLLLNTGFFSSSWAKALQAYGINVTELKAEIGDRVPISEVEKALGQGKKFKAVTVTHVDTSTGVAEDVKSLAETVRKLSPESFVFVDGVCAIGSEPLRFDEWDLDYVMTASQKAIGVPCGLHISICSKRALAALQSRKTPVPGCFHNLANWLPIMRNYEEGKPSYFATPSSQLVWALKTSLDRIASSPAEVEKRWADHARVSDKVKDALQQLNISTVAKSREVSAHGLTAAYLPEGWKLTDLTGPLLEEGLTITGGILQPIAPRYFRIGHMNASIYKDHIDRLIAELQKVFSQKSI